MATEKIVNYTAEQTATIVEQYVAAPTKATVEALAAQLGKSTRSIVAKLAKEGVYQAAGKPAGKRDMTKAEMVSKIAKLVDRTDEQLESLEKATGPALKAVIDALTGMSGRLNELLTEKE